MLVISSKYRPRSSLDSILVGDHRVNRSDKARNIGIAFDETLSLDKHVSSVCKSVLFHLWNIAKIRMHLTSESTKTLVYTYVTCRLDNCNSLLLGSPKYQGRSQDFSVGTHSFPSHLFTPPPPPKKKDQSHFRFTCLLFQIACARVLIEYRLTYFSVFFFFE